MNQIMGFFTEHNTDMFKATFSIIDNKVSLIPLDENSKEICRKLQYTDVSGDTDSWIYGYSNNHAIAILRRSVVPPSFQNQITFNSPMLIRSNHVVRNPEITHTFSSIIFSGGIIDILYPPQIAYKRNSNSFEIRNKEYYTKSFSLCINGEKFEMEYSVKIDVNTECGFFPNFSDTHSTLTFRFENEKPFSEIEKYYSYALSLCQFCTECMNVGFDINLFSKENYLYYSTKFSDSFDDYAESFINLSRVISLNRLDQDVVNLLKILVEEDTKPHLLFFSNRNNEYDVIKYTDVSDICVAIDREYRLLKIPYYNDVDKIDLVINDIKNFLDERGVEKEIATRVAGLLGNLRNPSPKTMMCELYKKYYSSVEKITNNGIEDELRTIKKYSIEEFEKLASKFVDIRNKVAHKGVIWNEGIKIYNHLKLLIYLSILDRSGFDENKSIEIVEQIFYSQFL